MTEYIRCTVCNVCLTLENHECLPTEWQPGMGAVVGPDPPEEDKAMIERWRWSAAFGKFLASVDAEGDSTARMLVSRLALDMLLKMDGAES